MYCTHIVQGRTLVTLEVVDHGEVGLEVQQTLQVGVRFEQLWGVI
jgi:hypothetical protein